jgi:tetratricopeptide (TPR) repeat protein
MIAVAACAACCCGSAGGQSPEVSPLRSETVFTELQQANDAVARRDFEAASQHFTAALEAARSFEPTAQDYLAEAAVQRGEQRLDDARILIQQALLLSPDDPALYRSLGIIEEEAGSPADAGAAYLEALRRKPDDVEAAMYLWGVYEQLRDYQGAVSTFTELTAAAPDNEFLQYYLGQAHFGNGSPELAVAALREAVRINPNDWSNNRELLSALRRSSTLRARDSEATSEQTGQTELDLDVSDNEGDVDQAVAEFERLAADPETGVPTVKLVLATLYVDRGDVNKALPLLRQLALSQSLDMQLRYNVAGNLAWAAEQQESEALQKQLYAEAAEQFYRVLGLTDEGSTTQVDVRIEYGRALVGAGKLVEALDELETAMYEWIERVPTRPTQLYFELGRAHYAAGEQDLAEENFRLFSRDLETYFAASVRGTKPDEKLEALSTLADIYFESGNYHSAAEVLKRAVTAIDAFGRHLRIDGTRTKDFRLQLARALLKEGDYPACIAELKKLQADPDVGHDARVLLAEAHLNQADPAKAVEQLKFVESSPGWNAAAMTLMGRALMASNDYAQAMTYLEQAQAAAPDDLEVLRLRAQCLALQRKPRDAEQIFNELLKKDPHSVEARLGLGDLAMQSAREANGTDRVAKYQTAQEHFQAAVDESPTNSIALANRDRAAELRVEAEGAVQATHERSRTVGWVLFIVAALSIPAAIFWWQFRKNWARRMFDQVTTLERDLKRLIRRQVQDVWRGDWEKLAGDPSIAGRVSYRYLREKMKKAEHPEDVLDVANFGHLVAIIDEGWKSLKFEQYGSEPTRPLVIAALSYIGNCRNAVFHAAELDQKLNRDGAGRQQPVKHMNRQVKTSLKTVRENLRLALDQEPAAPSDTEMPVVYATVVADPAP